MARRPEHPHKRRDRLERQARERPPPLPPLWNWTIKFYDAWKTRLAVRTVKRATYEEAYEHAMLVLHSNPRYDYCWIIRGS